MTLTAVEVEVSVASDRNRKSRPGLIMSHLHRALRVLPQSGHDALDTPEGA